MCYIKEVLVYGVRSRTFTQKPKAVSWKYRQGNGKWNCTYLYNRDYNIALD